MNFIGTWTTRDGSTAVVEELVPEDVSESGRAYWLGKVGKTEIMWDVNGFCQEENHFDLIERRREGVGQ